MLGTGLGWLQTDSPSPGHLSFAASLLKLSIGRNSRSVETLDRLKLLGPWVTGAHERDRTADLVLTKDVLCQLSYVSQLSFVRSFVRSLGRYACRSDCSDRAPIHLRVRRPAPHLEHSTVSRSSNQKSYLERETGLEPATPSLEGWCSSHLSYSRMKTGAKLLWIPSLDSPSELPALADSPFSLFSPFSLSGQRAGGERRIRTSVGASQQIYSLPRLTASVSLLESTRFADRAASPPSLARVWPRNPGQLISFRSRRVPLARARLTNLLRFDRWPCPRAESSRCESDRGVRRTGLTSRSGTIHNEQSHSASIFYS